ncbi:HAD family hydrolase [Candidatus Kuenenia stuttgartensis]|uniref:HAD family hydrolase n=1 Tax=Kuenenia stuttgartiensis TaxID=174633 RepID=UPI00146B783F|nr:HAD hydrolase-like protein [Candidatus Kuenenia stuttgartiensis]
MNIAYRAYNSSELSGIVPFSDVIPTLRDLKKRGFKLFLLTVGVHERQENKVKILGLKSCFSEIIINDQEIGMLMEDCILDCLKRHNLNPNEAVMVGDRTRNELRAAKSSD